MSKSTLTIGIKCKGAGTLALTQMTPLQGSFKVLVAENLGRLRRELVVDGFIEPISVWEDPLSAKVFILNGHQRHTALLDLKEKGWTDEKGVHHLVKVPAVPVNWVDAENLADAKRKVLALASQYGLVSTTGLKSLLAELGLTPEDAVGQFNFPEIDIASMMSGLEVPSVIGQGFEVNPLLTDLDISSIEEPERPGLAEEGETPELPKVPKARLGDIYQLGEHRLMCGDSTLRPHVALLMEDELADLVFTDPPYGVNYDGGHANPEVRREKLANDGNTEIYDLSVPLMYQFSKPIAPLYLWFAATKALQVLQVLQVNDFVIRNWIIWNKNMAQFGAIGAQYKQKHEPCLYAYKKGQTPFWDGPTNEVSVWDVARAQKNEFHPTQKPTDLAERALRNSCPAGGSVLDLFGGSGSTLIAAEKVGRRARVMELSPAYVDVILERWLNLTGRVAQKVKWEKETVRRPRA